MSQGQAQFPFYFWKGLATSGLAEQAAEEPLAAESTEEWTRGPSQRQPFLRMRNEGAIRAEPNSAPAAKGCELAFPAVGRVVTPGRGNYPSASQDTWVTGPSIKRKNNLPGQKQNKKKQNNHLCCSLEDIRFHAPLPLLAKREVACSPLRHEHAQCYRLETLSVWLLFSN